MGCLLGCFGRSKDRKRCKQRNKVLPRDKLPHGCSISHQNDALSEQKAVESSPISLVELQDNNNSEDKSSSSSSSSGSKKHVTFNSNVKTYDHVSPLYESKDSLPETTKSLTDEEEIEQISAKAKLYLSLSNKENSVVSSVGSYPPNYRYQNCRDSDDEIEECCDDNDDDEDNGYHPAFVGQEEWSESILTASMESRTENLFDKYGVEMSSVTDKDTKSLGKDNINLASEIACCIMSSSIEPIVKLSSSNTNPTSGSLSIEEVAVDASLSTWLSSSKINNGLESVSSKNNSCKSQSSKYVRNLEDRPILGALTVEELKEISKYSSSPRKSPCRSPDDMVIIGTVGTYWNESMIGKDYHRSVSSYKGIPNTNKKYSEDKKVNWHSTPFEKRLEQALNQASRDV